MYTEWPNQSISTWTRFTRALGATASFTPVTRSCADTTRTVLEVKWMGRNFALTPRRFRHLTSSLWQDPAMAAKASLISEMSPPLSWSRVWSKGYFLSEYSVGSMVRQSRPADSLSLAPGRVWPLNGRRWCMLYISGAGPANPEGLGKSGSAG